MSLVKWIAGLPAKTMIFFVRMYQQRISPLLGSNCKYQPTCSAYFIEAVQKYGAIKGGWKGVWRIMRCNPFSKGGHDPP